MLLSRWRRVPWRALPQVSRVAITGVAGPNPDEDGNPVDFVCIALASLTGHTFHSERNYRDLGRDSIQAAAMADALSEVIRYLNPQQRLKP
jgi:nicotinamide mononucleotide (NMN) deamidase PncC